MIKRIKLKRLSCVIFFLLIVFNLALAQEPTRDILKQNVTSLEVTKENSVHVLALLASKYKVPIGVEVSSIDVDRISKDTCITKIKDGNVQEVLEAVIACHTDLRWKMMDGVINVSSISSSEPFLDTIISDFEIVEKTIPEIRRAISERPEVKRILSETRSAIDELVLSPGATSDECSQLTFSVHNVTVREILNYIVRTTKKKYWGIIRWGNKKNIWVIIE